MPPNRLRKILFLLILLFSGFIAVNSEQTPASRENNTNREITENNNFSIPLPAIIAATVMVLLSAIYITTLIRERKRYLFLLKNMEELILIITPTGKILEKISGALSIDNLQSLFSMKDWKELEQMINRSFTAPEETVLQTTLPSLPVHQPKYYKITLQNRADRKEIRGIIVTLLDVTDARKMEEELINSRERAFHEARHDMLTGVPNRLYFHEIVSRKFFRLNRHPDETLCLLMIDLDHFKKVNDTWGHDAGDIVLMELTKLCSAEIRGSDVFARYGGEEFIVFLDDLGLEEGRQVAERMRKKVEVSSSWPDRIGLTISIGVAEFRGEDELEDLIKNADIALYRAKAMGRNMVCIYPDGQS